MPHLLLNAEHSIVGVLWASLWTMGGGPFMMTPLLH
jgi:hypothetical protein